MNNFFFIEDFRNNQGYTIKYNNQDYYLTSLCAGGTLNAIAAAVCGMSYGEYLLMCRDGYGAELYGKSGYPYAVFSDLTLAKKLAELLNNRMSQIYSEIKELMKN